MIPGLGSIVDRVTGLFGKTYFLAGFFPVLVLAAVSLLAGYDSSEWVYRQVNAFRGLDAGRQAVASGALLAAVAALGFVFWSANPWWRALMQGSALRGGIREWLVQDQRDRLMELEVVLRECEDRVFGFRSSHPDPEPEPEPPPCPDEPTLLGAVKKLLFPGGPGAPEAGAAPAPGGPTPWMDRLRDARAKGDALASPGGAAPSPGLVGKFDRVRAEIGGLKLVDAAALDVLCDGLERELAAAPVSPESELDRLHVEFDDLATRARARAENALNAALSARRSRFPLNLAVVGPTRMANLAELYRDHALTRYRLDPEVFWLHLQRSAAADDRFRPILEEARLKLDVSVAMAAACVLASSWAVVVGVAGHSVPVLLLTGVGLPAGALLFYHAAASNLRAYGIAVTATVDLFRFDVLEALHVATPPDSEAERQLWEVLTLSNQLLDTGRVAYRAKSV